MPDLLQTLAASQTIHDKIPQLAPVTASNLQTISPDTVTADRVKLFVAAQTRYAQDRVKEGRAELASWKSDGTPRTPPRAAPLASAFDTPVLKPRVPGTVLDAHLSPHVDDPGLPASRTATRTDRIRMSKDLKENEDAKESKEKKHKRKGKEVEKLSLKPPSSVKPRVDPKITASSSDRTQGEFKYRYAMDVAGHAIRSSSGSESYPDIHCYFR